MLGSCSTALLKHGECGKSAKHGEYGKHGTPKKSGCAWWLEARLGAAWVRPTLASLAHDVVGVVVRLPPSDGEAHESGEDGADHVVLVEIVRHSRVAEVVPNPSQLLPEDALHSKVR